MKYNKEKFESSVKNNYYLSILSLILYFVSIFVIYYLHKMPDKLENDSLLYMFSIISLLISPIMGGIFVDDLIIANYKVTIAKILRVIFITLFLLTTTVYIIIYFKSIINLENCGFIIWR